jgi:hypothetical protein
VSEELEARRRREETVGCAAAAAAVAAGWVGGPVATVEATACGGTRTTHTPRTVSAGGRKVAARSQDWILKCLQGGRAHPLKACAVATLCCSPPVLLAPKNLSREATGSAALRSMPDRTTHRLTVRLRDRVKVPREAHLGGTLGS